MIENDADIINIIDYATSEMKVKEVAGTAEIDGV